MLRLRRKGETFELSIGRNAEGGEATVLVGRYLSHGDLLDLKGRATRRGVVDEKSLDALFYEDTLVGWRELYDADGNLVPYSRARAAEVGAALPEDVAQLFAHKARSPDFKWQDAMGNSSGSSPAAAPATTPSPDSASA